MKIFENKLTLRQKKKKKRFKITNLDLIILISFHFLKKIIIIIINYTFGT